MSTSMSLMDREMRKEVIPVQRESSVYALYGCGLWILWRLCRQQHRSGAPGFEQSTCFLRNISTFFFSSGLMIGLVLLSSSSSSIQLQPDGNN